MTEAEKLAAFSKCLYRYLEDHAGKLAIDECPQAFYFAGHADAVPKWTRETPTTEGGYWFRPDGGAARVMDVGACSDGGLVAWWHNDWLYVRDMGGEWAGPLVAPE